MGMTPHPIRRIPVEDRIFRRVGRTAAGLLAADEAGSIPAMSTISERLLIPSTHLMDLDIGAEPCNRTLYKGNRHGLLLTST